MKRRTTTFILIAVVVAVLLGMLKMCRPSQSAAAAIPEPKVVQTQDPPFINPVSKKFNVPFTKFYVINGRDTLLKLNSGSSLYIPACTFEKNKNTQWGDTVEVRFREIDSVEEILATGIPMNTGNSSSEYLVTTGMMEFRASYKGAELIANTECPVKIELRNTDAGDNVNLYFLDEKNKKWDERNSNIPAKIHKTRFQKKISKKAYLQEASKKGYFMPVKPVVAKKDRYSFHFKIDLQQFPEVNIYDGIVWEFAGKKGSKEDPRNYSWLEGMVWKRMELDKTNSYGVYTLTLTSADKSFTTTVKPAFEKEDMEYAMDIFNDRYAKYQLYQNTRHKEDQSKEKVQEKIDLITRSFEINEFGIWNCDRYSTVKEPLMVNLKFELPEYGTANTVYVLPQNTKASIRLYCYKNMIQDLKLEKEGAYEILIVDNQGNLHKISKEEFKSMNFSKGTISHKFQNKGKEIESIQALQQVITSEVI